MDVSGGPQAWAGNRERLLAQGNPVNSGCRSKILVPSALYGNAPYRDQLGVIVRQFTFEYCEQTYAHRKPDFGRRGDEISR
jgi:hypothetical protein